MKNLNVSSNVSSNTGIDFIQRAEKGMPGGVATLDDRGEVFEIPSAIAVFTAEVDQDVLAGQPIYIKQSGKIELANNNQYIGIALENKNKGYTCQYTNYGSINRSDWSLIAGTTLLQPGQIYYLLSAGKITNIPPETGTLVVVGCALSTTTLSIQNQLSIIL